jgi:CRISPR-associated endonuclease Cas3-HD
LAHSIDVAAVMDALLSLPTLCRRLAGLAGRELSARDLRRLVALTFLHDIGKAGAGFQSRGSGDAVRAAWRLRSGAPRKQMGHVEVVAPLFGVNERFDAHRGALGLAGVLAWGGAGQAGQMFVADLWLAAISHHGVPVTAQTLNGGELQRGSTWLHPLPGYDPVEGLAQLGRAARELFPEAFHKEPMQAAAPGLAHAFAGLVSLADWIGSNTQDGFFPYAPWPQDLARWPAARERATEVLRRMQLDVEGARADLRRRAPAFVAVFGDPPRPAQTLAAEWSGDCDRDRVVVLEAETGSGKTEAALWRFKTLFEAGEVDALCFLLPTRVAATGIYDRLNRFIERLFPDPVLRPPTVLAVPYPAIASRGGIRTCADTGRRKAVRIDLQPAMRDAVAVAALAAVELRHGARVLVLRNTVRQAVATQQALEALLGVDHPALFTLGRVPALHHGRYAFEDRQQLDARVEALFGKAAVASDAACVLVGTQTLEISVDCDSEVMITDIAPIDVLLQRLGRLHRHAKRDGVRPPAAREPRLVVLTPADRDLIPLQRARTRPRHRPAQCLREPAGDRSGVALA